MGIYRHDQTKYTRLLHYELVSCNDGFLHYLNSELPLCIDSPLFIFGLL